MVAWFLVLHVFGFTMWISGLLMASFALTRHIGEKAPESRATLAGMERLALRALADPGAFLAITGGILLILTNSPYYLHAAWLHIKLLFVLLLIVLHVILGIRSKAYAAGRISMDRAYARLLTIVIVLLFISILVATLPGEVLLTH